MIDYVIDEKSWNVLKGLPNFENNAKYLYTFARKRGVTSNNQYGKKSTDCPNCGAPFNVTSAGKCPYCGSVVTTGEFNWVLCTTLGIKPNTSINNVGVVLMD